MGHKHVQDIHVEDNVAIGKGYSCRRCNKRLTGSINITKIIPNGIWRLVD